MYNDTSIKSIKRTFHTAKRLKTSFVLLISLYLLLYFKNLYLYYKIARVGGHNPIYVIQTQTYLKTALLCPFSDSQKSSQAPAPQQFSLYP